MMSKSKTILLLEHFEDRPNENLLYNDEIIFAIDLYRVPLTDYPRFLHAFLNSVL
jgi:hypothetical protein